MNDPIEMALDVSDKYGLEWNNESILLLFSEYIENQSDAGALLDFLEVAASMESDEDKDE